MAMKLLCLSCGGEFDEGATSCPRDGTVLTPIAGKPNLIGQTLDGRYKIFETIGEGQGGFVYKAQQLNFDRLVAIKVLHSHLSTEEVATKRFEREAKAISKLRHPNLLTMIDFGITSKGEPYMVTEYLSGVTLKTLIDENGALDVMRMLLVFMQLCDGLAVAHDQQILHRDLKPSNLLITLTSEQRELPKIIDFGLVKFLNDAEHMQLTQAGKVNGTPAYMSPEQCMGQKLDARSDLYSLACVLYEALTGAQPFIGADTNDCFSKQVNEAPPSFSQIAPRLAIPALVEKIVFKALSKAPDQRFQNMSELKEALETASLALSSVPAQTTNQPSVASVNSEIPVAANRVPGEVSTNPPGLPTFDSTTESSQQSRKQQYVMHDTEKGSTRLVARDHHQRVDSKESEVFVQMRRRQTEDLSERILRSVKSSFVGDQTMAWLQDVKEDVAIGTADATKHQLCQISLPALADKLFDDFQRYAYQFNQTEENREFVVTCTRPVHRSNEGSGAPYVGHLQNSIWAMKMIGDSQSVRFFFIPTQMMYEQGQELQSSPVLQLSVQAFQQGPGWSIDGDPIYDYQLPFLSKKVFARLMRVSRGEVSERDPLGLNLSEETKEVVSIEEAMETEVKQDPTDVITYALISILEAVDQEMLELRDSGVDAMKRGGIDAVSPIMLKTKQYEAFRESTASLAKEWAGMLAN